MSDTIVKKLYWARYRPKTIEAMILLPRIRKELLDKDENVILSGNFLFTGTPGNGKSSLANVIAGENCLRVNASFNSSVEDLKDRVADFCRTGDIFSDNGTKIVWLEEFDGVSAKYQEALRAFMEEHENVRFIATCNNLSKISPAMLSRFTVLKFDPENDVEASFLKEEYFERCMFIVDKNNLEINEDQVKSLININFPDLRSVLKALQRVEKVGGYNQGVNTSLNVDFYNIIFSGIDTEKTYNWVIESFGDSIDNLLKLCGRPLCQYIFNEKTEYIGAVTKLTDLYKEYSALFASGNIIDPVVLAVSYIYKIQETIQNSK